MELNFTKPLVLTQYIKQFCYKSRSNTVNTE